MNVSVLTRFIAASGLTNLADGIALVVWGWVASLLTRDPVLISLLPIALRLPWVIFAIPAGLVTDRADRRALILWADAVRFMAFATIAVAIFLALPLKPPAETGVSHPVLFATLAVTALVVGIAEVFRDNAAQTMLPAIVAHDDLERANGRLWSVELVGNSLAGPALGALLITLLVPTPFALNAFAFAAAFLLIKTIRGPFAPVPSDEPRQGSAIGEAFGFLRSKPILILLAVSTGVMNLIHQLIVIALVLHLQENLNAGAGAYGLILASGAVGGILAGFVSERIIGKIGRARSVQWAPVLMTVSFGILVLSPSVAVMCILFAIEGFAAVLWNTVSVSFRQRIIPDAMLGRVNSVYRLLAWGMMPIGLLMSGVLVRLSEGPLERGDALVVPFIAGAIISLLLTVTIWRPLGRAF